MTIKETRIILLLLVAASAAAQTTTVTGTITDPAGDLLSGSCSIQAVGPFSAATGWRVTGVPMVVPFSGGSFSAALAPTDSATPSGQYYRVTCSVPNQTVSGRAVGQYSWGPRYWLVPTNTTALDIGTVEITSTPPSPSWKVLWPQMDQGGATLGQVPQWNGSSWMPSTLNITGGTGAVTSVFGRTGAVVAQSGDYTTTQVPEGTNQYFTNARALSALSGLYESPLTFSAPLSRAGNTITCPLCGGGGTLNGDVTGASTANTVVALQGRAVAATAPADAQYLGWSAAASKWQPITLPPATVLSVFGRTGAVNAQAGDYTFSQISGAAAWGQLPTGVANTTNNLTDMTDRGAALQNLYFQANGTGAVNRGARDKLRDFVHVKDFGALGDGATDDSAAFTAALASGAKEVRADGGNYVLASVVTIPKGEALYFGAGTHTVAGILLSDSTTAPTGVGKLYCAGSGLTTIRLANGSNRDLVSQVNFSSLTGANSPYGLFRSEISGCTFDANKSGQAAVSYGIRLYGHGLYLHDVTVQNAYSDGIYTEWGIDSTYASPNTDLEGYFTEIRSMFNGSNGWTFRGPHDSTFTNVVLYKNGGWGLRVETSAAYNGNGHISNLNTYLNSNGGIYSNSSFDGTQVEATSSVGWGMLIDTGSGTHNLHASQFAGPIALEIRAPAQFISGNVVNSTAAAIKLNGGSCNCTATMVNNTGYQIDYTSAVGASIFFVESPNAIPGTMFHNTPSQADFIFLAFGGSGATNRYVALPFGTVHVAGWSPQFPQSNAVMAVINDGSQAGNITATSFIGTPILTPVSFGNLGTTNNSLVYCTDCGSNAKPCAGGGSGSLAFRNNGVWECLSK